MGFVNIPPDPVDDVGITQLTGDVTTPADSSGSAVATIANNAVTTAKILDTNVTTAKIADLNVTSGKLATAVQTDISTGRINSQAQSIFTNMGLGIKATALGFPYPIANASAATGLALTSGGIYLVPCWIPNAMTLTGVRYWQSVQGDYTANNENKVGLYTFSAGTLTLVASSTNDGDLWKGAAVAFKSKDFSSTYPASAGLYFIAALYSRSAVVTGPRIGTANTNGYDSNAIHLGETYFISSVKTGVSSLTTPIDITTALTNQVIPWLAVY